MDVIALTRAFVDVESTTFAEGPMGRELRKVLDDLATRYDGVVEAQPVAEDRFNLFARWGEPAVTFSTHFDCVPPFLASTEDDDFVYGRGSCDAKGILAAMIVAIEELLAEGVRNVALLAVVGEERNSEGAYVAAKSSVGSRYLINGEPTEGKLALGSKGALRLEVVATGKLAHSAYPELGDSAIEKLLNALDHMRAVPADLDPILGESTLNVGVISGGRAPNVISDEAKAEILVRLVDDGVDIARRLTAAAGPSVEVREVLRIPALHTVAIDGFEADVVRFTTDAGILAGAWGEPLIYGPGTIKVAHTDHERVAKKDLLQAIADYKRVARALLAREVAA